MDTVAFATEWQTKLAKWDCGPIIEDVPFVQQIELLLHPARDDVFDGYFGVGKLFPAQAAARGLWPVFICSKKLTQIVPPSFVA
jgi:hypothetical protein